MPHPNFSKRPGTDRKRAIIEWKGVRFIRGHSFLVAIKQIAAQARWNDVIKIGIVGGMGTGKTTLAQAIAHAFHTYMRKHHGVAFAVRQFGRDELGGLDKTLRELPPANYIVIFDDVSFMDASHSAKAISKIKNTLTTIRHREGGRDVKFVIIYGYHYNRGLDKFLRQTDFKFWTEVGDEEVEYMESMFHANNKHVKNLIQQFKRQVQNATTTGMWRAPYGRKGTLVYRYRDPFIPVLFSDGSGRLRPIIGPRRDFLTPHCPTCSMSEKIEDEIDPKAFVAEGEKAFGRTTFNQALKLIALENGIWAHSRSVLNAKRAVEKSLTVKRVNLERLLMSTGMVHRARPHKRASHDRFVAAIRRPPGKPAAAKKAEAAAAKKAAVGKS